MRAGKCPWFPAARRWDGGAVQRLQRPGAPVRVAVVDDRRINQFGTREVLAGVKGVKVPRDWILDFEEALERSEWDAIDVVVADVADEDNDDDQTPCVALARHIRAVSPSERPFIIAVTGNPVAYEEPFIQGRLLEADPNIGWVWRKDLEALITEAIDAGFFDDVPRLSEQDIPSEFPELGVDISTSFEDLFDEARQLESAAAGVNSDRKLLAERVRAATRAGVRAVTKEGNTPYSSDVPSIRQWRRILEKFQLPRRS